MPQITPDAIQAAVAVLGAVGSLFAFLGLFLWRMSGRVHEMLATQVAVTNELALLRKQMLLSARGLRDSLEAQSRRLVDLERSFAILAAGLAEREKDITKLEARAEQTHDDFLKVVSSLTQVMSSNDAMWRSLQRLHPNDIPKRASDRG